jgi:hypothetical protein
MSLAQVRSIFSYFDKSPSIYISVFAGRIADTRLDPIEVIVLRPPELLHLNSPSGRGGDG